MNKILLNALVFNIAWLVCVLGGNVIAVPVTVLIIAAHCFYMSKDKREIVLILLVVVLGILVDSVLIRTGFLLSPDKSLWPPLWLVCLWALFATTLNHSLRWFHTRTAIAVLVGGMAGALSYLAGTRLTDFSLKQPQLVTIAVMFVVWCGIFPLCLSLAKRILSDDQALV